MQVRVATPLRAQLAAVSSAAEMALLRSFSDWKAGQPEEHYWFSRDVRGDDGHLYHVHMVPNNEAKARKDWNSLWFDRPRRPWLRRSDRYLLYANGGQYGYLLLALIEDPGAHKLWTPALNAQRLAFEVVAENFVYFGQVNRPGF